MYVLPPGVRDQTSHPYRTTSKIIPLYYILIFGFSEEKTNDSDLNGIKKSPKRICFNFFLNTIPIFRLFPSIWTLSHFRRIYLLPYICYGLSCTVVSRHEHALVFSAFTSGQRPY
jgi:hypothetical protein